jgi:1-acyl-sn-glycerol-3-phosphate acyltransferase
MHWLGSCVFRACSKPVVLHASRANRPGAYLLVAPHLSPFDVPLLYRHTPRKLDFVSITELFAYRFIRWLYGSMNAFPLDRSRADSAAVRTILDRLARGRVVAMFPEGGLRTLERSVLRGGRMRSGTGRIAQLAGVPVIPAVVLGATKFAHFVAWLPLRRVRYGVIYGEPIEIDPRADTLEAPAALEDRLRTAFASLFSELESAMQNAGRASGSR